MPILAAPFWTVPPCGASPLTLFQAGLIFITRVFQAGLNYVPAHADALAATPETVLQDARSFLACSRMFWVKLENALS